jgi:hypothetical protein
MLCLRINEVVGNVKPRLGPRLGLEILHLNLGYMAFKLSLGLGHMVFIKVHHISHMALMIGSILNHVTPWLCLGLGHVATRIEHLCHVAPKAELPRPHVT